jgi:hypothetical protein
MIQKRPRIAFDIECYRNYFLAGFTLVDAPSVRYDFEMFEGQPLDLQSIANLLAQFTVCTFNGNNYDMPMISAALLGYDCAQLKWLSDKIIQPNGMGMKPWEIEREFKIYAPDYVDHIDIFDILPGQYGLKMYMAKMQSETIQDLPIPPDALIPPEQRPAMRTYCANDRTGVIDGLRQFKKEIELRERMSDSYGIDLRSKSDAQIAEAVIKHELGFRVERPEWAVGTWFSFDPPPYIQFQTPVLQQLLERVKQARFVLGESAVELPYELDADKNPAAVIRIGSTAYTMGLGGLHSTEKSVYHISDANNIIEDIDVRSYYPEMMLNSGYYPPQMGEAFRTVFRALVNQRLAAKDAGDDATAASLKITINGTFGKTLSKYGVLSAPKFGVQTTVGGQLSILMLIEALDLHCIPVVSANTDGIVVKCPRQLTWLRDQIVADWERRTGLKTEAAEYAFIGSRDVNNYVAVKSKDRSVKLKGEYAPPVPVGGSWPNPTGQICVEALTAWLLHNIPLAQTIRACTDVRKFVYIRSVKGGGQYIERPEIEALKTKGGMRSQLALAGWVEVEKEVFQRGPHEPLPMKEAHKIAIAQLRAVDSVPKHYLGKVVRWYYAKDSTGLITYVGSGNKVAGAEGCAPLMTLPPTLPHDVDYEWYEREAESLISQLGIAYVKNTCNG